MRKKKEGITMQQVSDYELELMKIIWANGGAALYAEVVEKMASRVNTLTNNTILTLLSRLTEKGILEISKTGRRNIYTAAVSEDEYQTDQTVRFLDKIYEGDTKGLVSALIAKDLISKSDYEELLKKWEGGDGADE